MAFSHLDRWTLLFHKLESLDLQVWGDRPGSRHAGALSMPMGSNQNEPCFSLGEKEIIGTLGSHARGRASPEKRHACQIDLDVVGS